MPAPIKVEEMTLRDYFIAHAPAEPQPWFTMEFVAKFMTPRPKSGYMDVPTVEQGLWDEERKRLFYGMWPGAWADLQLSLRDMRKKIDAEDNHAG